MLLNQESKTIPTKKISNYLFSNNQNNIHQFDSGSACQTCKLRKTCIASKIELSFNNSAHQINHRSALIKQSEHIYFIGDRVEAIYIVKSGSFKSYVINNNGNEQIIDFHLPGDILGFDAMPVHHFESSAVALETSSVCTIQVSQLEHLMEDLVPDWLIKVLMGTLKQQQRNISVLGKKDAKSRLATFLWDISRNYQSLGFSKNNIRLNMSRQDIGNYLGLASETISRIFTKMQNDGILQLERREVRIVNFDLLCELADKESASQIGTQLGTSGHHINN